MLNERVLSTACRTSAVRTPIVAPAIKDVVDLRLLLDLLREVKSVRAVASSDAEEFSRRIDSELPRYRSLAARFEGSSGSDDRRQLQSSLTHLHNLRFALRNALSAIAQADGVIAGVHRKIGGLSIPTTWRAA